MEESITSSAVASTTTTTTNVVEEIIASVWKGHEFSMEAEYAKKVLSDENVCGRLRQEGIVVKSEGGEIVFSRENVRPATNVSHKYIMPDCAADIQCLIDRALDGHGMANIALYGTAGTGKSELVHELAKINGLKVFQINGSEGLTSSDFYGNLSVSVDEKTGQNYTFFDPGVLCRAFVEGTKLDENGHQVLDANGEPIVIGKPAVFFLDEFAAMLPEVFLGVFNRVLELPRQGGKGRTMEVPMDGGRIVKSHPGMIVFLAGNTVGTGNSGRYQMGYTAQSNHLDESTRNRITAYFHLGYNKKAELSIVLGMLNDDYEASRLMRLRDNARNMFRKEEIETLFSTRTLTAICDMAWTLRKAKRVNWITDAIKASVYDGLPEGDKPAFNEMIRMIYSIDYNAIESNNADYDIL